MLAFTQSYGLLDARRMSLGRHFARQQYEYPARSLAIRTRRIEFMDLVGKEKTERAKRPFKPFCVLVHLVVRSPEVSRRARYGNGYRDWVCVQAQRFVSRFEN